MNKKFLSAVLFGALMLTSTGTFVSCKDYDDDIENLQGQIDKNAAAIEAINALIAKGSVITSVDKGNNGITIKLSNGQSYEITNGADGKAGINGTNGKDADVWTINAEGFWCKNGEVTEFKAVGEKGEAGDKGEAGQNGGFYRPNAQTHEFEYVTIDAEGNEHAEKTGISWLGTGVTAIETEESLILGNVSGSEDGTFTISKLAELRSLVFVPQVVVDGVEGIRYGQFTYSALTLDQKDSKNEYCKFADKKTMVNPVVTAQYHVNPANADLRDIKEHLSFLVEDKDYISSRAASKDLEMTPKFEKFENGVLTVKVNIKGAAATDEMISLFALQAKNEKTGQNVVSDYATLYQGALNDITIARPMADKKDYHYRNRINTLRAGTNALKIWDSKDVKSCDVEMVYDQTLDLMKIVEAHELAEAGCTKQVAGLEKYGFKFNFEIVKNYKVGEGAETPQEEFIQFTDEAKTVLGARVYDATNGLRAAIGRTPIIRVTIVDTNNKDAIVKVAYIKVHIVDTPATPIENKSFDLSVDPFKFECGKSQARSLTVKEINVKVLNELGMSFEQFITAYPYFKDVKSEDIKEAGLCVSTSNESNPETNIVEWTMLEEDLWNHAGEAVKNVVRYYEDEACEGRYVQFVLNSTVEGVKKVYNVTEADYIFNYWDDAKTFTKFNVAVPNDTKDENPANCVFKNNLNAPFTTWEAASDNAGIIKLDAAITAVEYYFAKAEVEKLTKIGDLDVKFTVVASEASKFQNELRATMNGKTEVVATIFNGAADMPNYVTYNKESEIAKLLLNTNKMYTYIGARAYVCGSTDKQVAIKFNGKDYFQANYIRPVSVTGKAADNFIDGVDFKEKGSYIRLEDLVSPSDWRGRAFSEYENYWDFYGPFEITVDTENVECDLGGKRQSAPTTLELKIADKNFLEKPAKATNYGYLTYKNNGSTVEKEFNVFVKVTVKYGWGEIVTEEIKVPVSTTIEAPAK